MRPLTGADHFADRIDEPLAAYSCASLGWSCRTCPQQDERGSIISIFNADASVAAINRYDEFGVPQSTNIGRLQYTGQAWLAEDGIQYSKARMYSPALGRFYQPDPVGYEDSPNLYAYVGNDPVNLTDPWGLRGCAAAYPDSPFVPCPNSDPGVIPLSWSFQRSTGIDLLFGGRNSVSESKVQRRPRPPLCPSVARLTLGFGGGGSFFLGTRGATGNASFSVSIPLSLWRSGLAGIEGSLSLSAAGFVGKGAFLGYGAGPIIGIAPANSRGLSFSSSEVVQAGAAWNLGAEVAAQFNGTGSGPTSSSVSGPRVGYGAYVGGGPQGTATLSTGQLFCRQ